MRYQGIREEELKNKVAADWFSKFDTTVITGNIDFALYPKAKGPSERAPLLWAEAKTGNYPLPDMLAQLVLTIGKARTFDHVLPPPFLGALDGQKIAFLPYEPIAHIFHQSDFNWNVAPSDHSSREFVLVRQQINDLLDTQAISVFDYDLDAAALKAFIHGSLSQCAGEARVRIDKNNFYPIYLRWLEAVKPNIAVDWADLKQHGILDSDFFLADLFVDDRDTVSVHDDISIRESLFVVFQSAGYRIAKENLKGLFDAVIAIKNLQAYQQFWAKYKRPPLQEYQEYIITRRDLLVPQDIRERKGAFFTPRQWVELSQQYLADYLGENWQEEYYVWDCAAGTGNLLAGLTNRYRIFASTLDQADVSAMRERIEHGANLLSAYVFQFDFLNDPLTPQSQGGKLPDRLYEIITDPEKRKKLVVYINPPYAENTTKNAPQGKVGVNLTMMHKRYSNLLGTGGRELFAQFLIRVYMEFRGPILANFSKLKNLQGSAFLDFRKIFQPKLCSLFLAPADTFDNVKGQFPIGFYIWNTSQSEPFSSIVADVFDCNGNPMEPKTIRTYRKSEYINAWIAGYKSEGENTIGWMDGINGNDFQHNNIVHIVNDRKQIPGPRGIWVTHACLLPVCVYFAVRKTISSTWLNDRDQFTFPDDGWLSDNIFQADCLTYTLFHDANAIKSTKGINHWIPFLEEEVNAQEEYASHFMTDFMRGKCKPTQPKGLQTTFPLAEEISLIPQSPMVFSAEAQAVFSAGRNLWRYYHAQPHANPNASYYDIREHFQGRNDKGIMNAKSDDAKYTELLAALRAAVKALGDRIAPKVYQYGFLKGEPEGL